MIGRRTSWVAAAVIGAAAVAAMFWQPSASLAKPGLVTDNDGITYIGDVTEAGGKLTVTDDGGSAIEIQKANVKSTKYFDTPQDEFNGRIGALAANDVGGRIAVAKWALKQKQPELAKQAADEALKIAPNNAEAISLRKTAEQQMAAAPTPAAGSPDNTATTNPTTGGGKMRLVTPAEINRIRQTEWQAGDESVRVKIDKEAKDAFIARSRDLTPKQFNGMSPTEQARVIIKGGTDKMRSGVHLLSDPAPMMNYRKNIQKMMVTNGCAAGGCHDASASKSNFVLYTDPGDEAAYTNYLILQNYKTKVGDRVRQMVDRDQPDDSLLAEFALNPKAAQVPHPEVKEPVAYNGIFRTAQDPRFKTLTTWLRAMPTIQPSYGVDLTKPPIEEEKPAAEVPGAAPEKAPASPIPPAKGAAAPSAAPAKAAAPQTPRT